MSTCANRHRARWSNIWRENEDSMISREAGWTDDRIVVIDEDQGKSGAKEKTRTGFSRLIEAVAQGLVSIVIALEITRLSRNSPDWHINMMNSVAPARCFNGGNTRGWSTRFGAFTQASIRWRGSLQPMPCFCGQYVIPSIQALIYSVVVSRFAV